MKAIVKQVIWLFYLIHLGVIILFIRIWFDYSSEYAPFLGGLSYITLSMLLKNTIGRHHRQGIRLVKSEDFEMAIKYFQKSYAYFEKRKWLDQFRVIFLLSLSKKTYREMALNNIAYCYSQIGKGEQAKAYYQKTLDQFPDNDLAASGLNMLNSVSEDSIEEEGNN